MPRVRAPARGSPPESPRAWLRGGPLPRAARARGCPAAAVRLLPRGDHIGRAVGRGARQGRRPGKSPDGRPPVLQRALPRAGHPWRATVVTDAGDAWWDAAGCRTQGAIEPRFRAETGLERLHAGRWGWGGMPVGALRPAPMPRQFVVRPGFRPFPRRLVTEDRLPPAHDGSCHLSCQPREETDRRPWRPGGTRPVARGRAVPRNSLTIVARASSWGYG
jgi:hypothetical protein